MGNSQTQAAKTFSRTPGAANQTRASGSTVYQQTSATSATQRSTTSGVNNTTTQRNSGFVSPNYTALGATTNESIDEIYATDRLLHDYYAAQRATSGVSSTTTQRTSPLANVNSAAGTVSPRASDSANFSSTSSATFSGTNSSTSSCINRATFGRDTTSGTNSSTVSCINRTTFGRDTTSGTNSATTQSSAQGTSGSSSTTTTKKSLPRVADSDPLYNCPGCGLRFGIKIYQCELSHSLCADCSVCVKCKKHVTRRRNYALETLVSERMVPCHNEDRGCDKTMLPRDLEEHLMGCSCKEIICPAAKLLQCVWRGVVSQLEHHFKEAHPTMNGRFNQEVRIRHMDDQYNVNFATLGAYKFLVHFKVVKAESVAILVQILSENIEASKWTYEWHVYNSNEPRRKFLYAGNCLHASESVDEKFGGNDCGVLPMHYVKNILKFDMFTYKVFIRKSDCQDELPAMANRNRNRNNRQKRNNRQRQRINRARQNTGRSLALIDSLAHQ